MRTPRWLVFLGLLALVCRQSAYALDPSRALTQYVHRIWQVQQGLPQSTIYSIRQTDAGYLLLGTQTGLVRFDGVRFMTYEERDEALLKNLWIQDVLEDANHDLWIASDGQGLIRLHDGVARKYSKADGFPSEKVQSLLFDRHGTLWACTPDGLVAFSRERFVVYRKQQGLVTDELTAACEAKDGTLWVGGDSTQLSLWDGKTFTTRALKSTPPYATVRAMVCSEDDAIWVGTSNGLVRIKDDKEQYFTTANGLADNWIYCLTESHDGTIWAGTKDGFSRIRGGEVESFHARDGLSQSSVYTLFEDQEGSLWVGTKHGLNQFLERRTIPFTESEGLSSNDAGPVVQGHDGSVWVGTLGDGLNKFDGHHFSVLSTKGGLASDSIVSLADGGDGGLWVGGDKGLNHLTDGKVDATYTAAQGLPAPDIRCLFRDTAGALWVGTSKGLAQFIDGRFATSSAAQEPFTACVRALGNGPSGSLLFATEGGGVFSYAHGKLDEVKQDGASIRDVDAFFQDKDGLIWMGAIGGGLRLIDGGKVFRYSMKDGLFDDDIYGIVADEQDRLWMACSKGIFYVNRGDLRKFAAGNLKSLVSTPFSPTEAQRTIECKSGVQPAAWRMQDGRLWFSTIRGVIVIDPSHLQVKLPPTPVVIEDVVVNGKSERPSQIVNLAAGLKNLEFRYTALSFSAPGRITFRYKLEGFDRDWIEAEGRREAFYTNLPPGKFTFRVMACNVDNVWNEAASPVAFTLAPPFYERAWFILLCLAMAAFLIFEVYRARMRRVRQRLAAVLGERSRIARELHDTLIQGFSGVTMQMQALSTRLPSPSDSSALQEIVTDAGACLREARRSVAGLRSARGPDSGLAAAIAQAARQLTEEKDIRLKLRLQPSPQELPADVQYNLLRIAQEAVSNSVKHSGSRTIEVGLDFTSQAVELSIKDEGSGLGKNGNGGMTHGHYGLIGMKERASQIGADFHLESEPGRGTTVRVRLSTPKESNGG